MGFFLKHKPWLVFFLFFLSSLIFFLSSRPILAATVIWDGGGTDGTCGGGVGDGNNWSCGANWNTNNVPGSSDLAVFDSSSTKDAVVDLSISVTGVSINSGYSGTLTQAAAIAIGSSGFIQNAGVFIGGSQDIDVNGSFTLGSGVNFTATSGTLSVERNLTISSSATYNAHSGTVALDGAYGSASRTFDAPGITFYRVTISWTHSATISTRTLTISTGTTVPLGNSPTVTILNSYAGRGTNLINNGTITMGTGNAVFNIEGPLTNNGTIYGAELSSWTENGGIVNNGTINMSSLSSFDFNSYDANAAGDFTNSAGAAFLTGENPAFYFEGGLMINSGSTFPTNFPITLDGSYAASNTIDCAGIVFSKVTINRTINSTNGKTLTIASGTTLPLGDSPSVLLENSRSGSTNYVYNLNNQGTITLGSGSSAVFTVEGTFTNDGTINGGEIPLIIVNSNLVNNKTINAPSLQTLDINRYGDYYGSFTNNTGAVFVTASNPNLSLNSNLTLNSGSTYPQTLTLTLDGTEDSDDSTVTAPGVTFSSLTINKTYSSGNTSFSEAHTIIGNFIRIDGPLLNPETTMTFNVGGNLSVLTADNFGGSNLSLILNGSGNQSLTQSSSNITFPITVNKSAGKVILASDFTGTDGFTLQNGTLDLAGKSFTSNSLTIGSTCTLRLMGNENFSKTPIIGSDTTVIYYGDGDSQADQYSLNDWNYTNLTADFTDTSDFLSAGSFPQLTITGSFSLNSGSFLAPKTLKIAGNLAVGSSGSFTHNSGTVNLNGTGQVLSGNATFYNLIKEITSSDTLTFTAGSRQTVTGTLTLKGIEGELLFLRSSSDGQQWEIDPQASRDIGYLKVKDSLNVNSEQIAVNGLNITDSGNNDGWLFDEVSTDTQTEETEPVSTASQSYSSYFGTTSPPGCGDQTPGAKAPWLYGAVLQDSNSVMLYFTSADDPVDKYVLEYGVKSGHYVYGVVDLGISLQERMTFLVKALSPDTTYYFRIRAGNGCAVGPWSEEISIKTQPLVVLNRLAFISSDLLPVETQNGQKESVKETDDLPEEGYKLNIKVTDEDNRPVNGATVTLHSKIQQVVTGKDGVAVFKNVEKGNHRVLIAYNKFEGEQSLNLQGETKEFSLSVQIKPQNIWFSTQMIMVISVLGLIIVILAVLLIKARKHRPSSRFS